MKKFTTRLLICLILVATVAVLAACGVDPEEVVGTYHRAWTYEGNSYEKWIVLESGGTYAVTTLKNGALHDTETGDWELDGSKLHLYDSTALTYHGAATVYTYSDGKIQTASSVYTKQ